MNDDGAWAIEKALWLGGPERYEQSVDRDCVMVFPGIGAMEYDAIVEEVRQAPRWADVELSERRLSRPQAGLCVLAYKAAARREGDQVYGCWCSSTYRDTGGGWQLVQHQQTPL
ncbi:DUF4440 domain-containing protein [Sphingopyxis indica]|uniref:DUF4440 domain-containing protein n=1 Tax=Sphingopyxis indica TaxID=436663 RepID=UPI002938E3D1|nr:DUF4440 domain-containing protein [Sphingopyxis indica]WOF44516.1 DUF4440 domain-containing protein [Sphingopyxis indica]